MNDMGPRRMDGFARPAGGSPQPAARRPVPRPRPVAAPVSRPVAPQPQQPQQAYAPAPQPVARSQQPARPQQQPQRQEAPASARQGGGWRVVVQFVIGLLVIAGVAAAIVALYVRYYQ